MIQDLGATFGPTKVNLSSWRDRPVWRDSASCLVTMKDLPFAGATFPDAQISEAGRMLLAEQLRALSEADVKRIFIEARFPDFYSATDDERDIEAWAAAFQTRVDQIAAAGPCPASGSL